MGDDDMDMGMGPEEDHSQKLPRGIGDFNLMNHQDQPESTTPFKDARLKLKEGVPDVAPADGLPDLAPADGPGEPMEPEEPEEPEEPAEAPEEP